MEVGSRKSEVGRGKTEAEGKISFFGLRTSDFGLKNIFEQMVLEELYEKSLQLIPLDIDEGVALYNLAPLEELMFVANRLRQLHNPGNIAGWMIDRNVNITNVCFSQCSFCNFCRKKGSADAYITSIDVI